MAKNPLSPPALTQVSIPVPESSEEAVAVLMEAVLGIAPSLYTDVDTKETLLSVYLQHGRGLPDTKRKALLNGLKQLVAHGLLPEPVLPQVKKLPAQDWAESWKSHFPTIVIEDRLLVKPPWDKSKPREGQVEVVLDPGLSFGTGHHATTSYCLRQLVKLQPKKGRPWSFVDIGTGSGILAIAAAKLGYEPVLGFDFDPVAVRVALENAAVNGVGDRTKFLKKDLVRSRKAPDQADVVCANLLADILKTEADKVAAHVRPGGYLVVAGILAREFDGVATTYKTRGFKLVDNLADKEWQSGLLRRNKSA